MYKKMVLNPCTYCETLSQYDSIAAVKERGWVGSWIWGLEGKKRGCTKSSRPRVVAWLSLSKESAIVLARSECCLTESWRLISSDACCCNMASKKLLAVVIELLSFTTGSLSSSITLLIILSDTVIDRSSSAWSQIEPLQSKYAIDMQIIQWHYIV